MTGQSETGTIKFKIEQDQEGFISADDTLHMINCTWSKFDSSVYSHIYLKAMDLFQTSRGLSPGDFAPYLNKDEQTGAQHKTFQCYETYEVSN